MALVNYNNQGAIRNLPLSPSLKEAMQLAILDVYGPGYRAEVYSGGQHKHGSRRTGSVRHDEGKAGDFHIYGPDGRQVSGDDLAPLIQYWSAKGTGGVGAEMRGGGIHLDEHATPPKGGGMFWDYRNQGGRLTPKQREAYLQGKSGQLPDLVERPAPPRIPERGGSGAPTALAAIQTMAPVQHTAPTMAFAPPPTATNAPMPVERPSFFPNFPTPPPGLQEATEAKAARMAPPTPIAPPMGIQDQQNPFQQVRQGVRGMAPGLFNKVHDLRGQFDGVKLGLQNRARSDLMRALGNRDSSYADPSETRRMGFEYGPKGYIYGRNQVSGRREQVGKRSDGRDSLYNDVDLTKAKRKYNARTNRWSY